MQSIYEGDVRFEHCYRLDLDPNIASSHREECWREWATSYTYGQTQDRADYARQRLEQLRTRGDSVQRTLEPSPDPAGQGLTEVAPEQVSAHRSPPPTVQPRSTSATESVAPEPPEHPPSHECATACRKTWAECNPADKLPGEITSESERGACDRAYARCMRRCFEE